MKKTLIFILIIFFICLGWEIFTLCTPATDDTISTVIRRINHKSGGLIALGLIALWLHWFFKTWFTTEK